MKIQPDISACNIVILGDFNPKIFTPDWLYMQSIISAQEKEACEIEVIHSEVSKFRCDWFLLEVTKDRFFIETLEAPFVRILDLVGSIFGEFLIHTPIRMFGINRHMHFSMNRSNMIALGKDLAPSKPWGEWGKEIDADEKNGMRSLAMEQNVLDDRDKGYVRTTVQPSGRLEGVYISVNDHYELINQEATPEGIQFLTSRFEESVSKSEWIAEQVLGIK